MSAPAVDRKHEDDSSQADPAGPGQPGGIEAILAKAGMDRRDLLGSLADLLDPATCWYQRWYFLLRLEDEIYASLSSRRPTSLIAIRIPLAGTDMATRLDEGLRRRLSQVASEVLRPGDLPGSISEGELAVYLPETDIEEAERIALRLQAALASFSPRLGLATSPVDGTTAYDLLVAALRFNLRPLPRIADLESYRRRRDLDQSN